jgi:hypothetical protein
MILRKILTLILLFLYVMASAQMQEKDSTKLSDNLQFSAIAEMGFLGVFSHKVQFSNSGTYFDYRKDGGQDVFFPVGRFSLELNIKKRNTIIFLYQPLRLESQVNLKEDLIVDDLTFPANTGVKLLYNFPFYRFSYIRELIKNNETFNFAIGASLQIRNATISFESNDGSLFRTNRDLGPVPALKIRTRKDFGKRFYLQLEADGMYAPISVLNGSSNETTGAILDASLQTGLDFNRSVSSFLNLRYLGGGAVGTSESNGPGDGYVKNWLHFYTLTVGLKYTL